ncbi:MAG: serine/threonine protein kinase [Akkermansia sp.]|nr:serine/threonine protein kinase [Akkermansia sp.]
MPDTPDKEEELALLVEEYLEALRCGKAPALEEFVAAHSEHAEDLNDLLKGMVDMEALSVSNHSSAVYATARYPESLGGYRLMERIGAGGMGTVFRAMQESLHREVAVKILSPAWNADERHCEAFENESRVIAGLHHTNIVEVFGAGQEGDYRYYVMSLVNGQGITPSTIRNAYPGVPYEVAVAKVGLQAAQALAYAHSCGVLHRDVKPGNLLLDADGVLRVGDFGLATVLNNGEAAPLVTQSHDGTLRYMPPERLMKGENSFAGDQYSLGVTLYELVCNRPAFRESEPGKLIHRIVTEPLSTLRGEGELGAIINKSISFDPADRYASMADMADDLRRFLDGEPVKARPASWTRRYAMWLRRRPAVAVWSHAAALLVFLLFGSILWGYAGESKQRKQAERNAAIADTALQEIFASMADRDAGDDTLWRPTKADTQLLQQLMPYYEEIALMADNKGNKMAEACQTLAIIAQQTQDYATAEQYFSRALSLSPELSAAYFRNLNGLCSAMYEQKRRQEAEKLLKEAVAKADLVKDIEARLELIRSLQFLSQGSPFRMRWQPGAQRRPGMVGGEMRPPRPERLDRKSRPDRPERQSHRVYQEQAIALMNEILAQDPLQEKVQVRRIELLMSLQRPDMQRRLLDKEQTVEQLFDELLVKYPESTPIQRSYVQWVVRPFGKQELATLERGARFARALLADDPGSTEVLMLYLTVRERLASALSAAGQEARARREKEMTLGVVSLITTRSDYTPEMRERLAMLVSVQPQADDARDVQEEEISLLLDSLDEKRMKEVRERIKAMRTRRPRPNWGAPMPPKPRESTRKP